MGKRRSEEAAQLADSRTEAFFAEHLVKRPKPWLSSANSLVSGIAASPHLVQHRPSRTDPQRGDWPQLNRIYDRKGLSRPTRVGLEPAAASCNGSAVVGETVATGRKVPSACPRMPEPHSVDKAEGCQFDTIAGRAAQAARHPSSRCAKNDGQDAKVIRSLVARDRCWSMASIKGVGTIRTRSAMRRKLFTGLIRDAYSSRVNGAPSKLVCADYRRVTATWSTTARVEVGSQHWAVCWTRWRDHRQRAWACAIRPTCARRLAGDTRARCGAQREDASSPPWPMNWLWSTHRPARWMTQLDPLGKSRRRRFDERADPHRGVDMPS